MPNRLANGFSLIELMLALVVLGILTAIALPSYQSYRAKMLNTKAIGDMLEISQMLERWHTVHGTYPPDLASLGATPNDPWAHPYQYLNIEAGVPRGAVRKDKSLNPLNSDFDLYSMGPDGLTSKPLTAAHARDDIVRAGNGGFIGLATEH